MAQRCEHLRQGESGEVCALPGGIVAEVCNACLRELQHRLSEEHREETPIEAYAREREIAMQQCTWKSEKGKPKFCQLLAQEGSAFCPRHTFLHNIEAQAKRVEEQAADVKKQVAALGKAPETRHGLIAKGYRYDACAKCRGCEKVIEFWLTPALRKAPFDLMPEADSPAVSHFATCTHAGEFKRSA